MRLPNYWDSAGIPFNAVKKRKPWVLSLISLQKNKTWFYVILFAVNLRQDLRAGLELLLLPPKYLDYRYVSQCQAFM